MLLFLSPPLTILYYRQLAWATSVPRNELQVLPPESTGFYVPIGRRGTVLDESSQISTRLEASKFVLEETTDPDLSPDGSFQLSVIR